VLPSDLVLRISDFGGIVVPRDIVGAYRLHNLVGTGANSQVFEVVEMASGLHFAMKLLLPENVRNQEMRRLLFHEAAVGLKLAKPKPHPNVIQIYKVAREETEAYFVMDFFPAGSLKARILRKDDEFIRAKAHDIFRQAATGLAYMNSSGWIHRDVKPDNLLVNASGDVKLIDFAIAFKAPTGLAKLFRRKGKPVGTRSYMSPEQIRDQIVDTRADIYSFGATIYEVITGRPPFRGTTSQELLTKHLNEKPLTPQAYNSDVTDEFAALVLKMLAKKREDRPRNFHEILIQLRGMRVFKTKAPQKSN
jgi:serine/threonine protein kinase